MVDKMGQPAASDPLGHRWRFAVVLLASLLLAVAQPLLSRLLGEQGSFDVFFSLLIAAVLLLVSVSSTSRSWWRDWWDSK